MPNQNISPKKTLELEATIMMIVPIVIAVDTLYKQAPELFMAIMLGISFVVGGTVLLVTFTKDQ